MDILSRTAEWRRTVAQGLSLVTFATLFASTGFQQCAAQDDLQEAEYHVKAAFLYKFGGYVEWPDGAFARPDSPLVVGVIGASALADELARIVADRTVNGRAVTVRKLRIGDLVSGLHVLFIGRSDGDRLVDILAATKRKPLLIVTESERALERGSVINFIMVDEKVRFDVAIPSSEAGNIKISARLLAVARKVVKAPS